MLFLGLSGRAPVDLDACLGAFAAAHADVVAFETNSRVMLRRARAHGKVALISGGGSGHEPLHIGFVGRGMLDAACPGEIFTSPTPRQIAAAHAAVAGPEGALMIVKNYAGDVMNFEMAAESLPGPVRLVLVADDIAIGEDGHDQGRRGLAGTLLVHKIVGAAAEAGADLAACAALGENVVAAAGSMAIAFSGCRPPANAEPTFTLAPGEMEVGVGIHGEIGRGRLPALPPDALARMLVDEIVAAKGFAPGSPILMLVNGLGGTPALDLLAVAAHAERALADRGLACARRLVGSFCTSLDMAGVSLTLAALDARTLALWDAPVATARLAW